MTDEFTAYIDPKDLAEFHIAMEHIDQVVQMDHEWRDFLVPLKRELRTYPAMLPGQKYKRTYNLKRNWQYVIHPNARAEMTNMAKYAGWVQGVEQAEIHQGRWAVAFKVADERLTEFIEKLSKKIGRVWTK